MDDRQITTQAPVGLATVGPYWDAGLTAPSHLDRAVTLKLGVPYRTFRVVERSDAKVAHFFGIVRPCLAGAVRLFRGVNRRMKYYDDMDADKKVYAYVLHPPADVFPVPSMDGRLKLQEGAPPKGRVFAVLMRPFPQADSFGMEGAILHWNWMDGDSVTGPIDHDDRYEEPIW